MPDIIKLHQPLSENIEVMIHILGGVPSHEQFQAIKAHIDLVDNSLNCGQAKVTLKASVPVRTNDVETVHPIKVRPYPNVLTEKEKSEILRLYADQSPVLQIVKSVGRPFGTVRNYLIRAGVYRQKWTNKKRDEMNPVNSSGSDAGIIRHGFGTFTRS